MMSRVSNVLMAGLVSGALILTRSAGAGDLPAKIDCQSKILTSDIRRSRCESGCERSNANSIRSAECAVKCESKFQAQIADSLSCIGSSLIRHIRVPANLPAVDTGIDLSGAMRVTILASGRWSADNGDNGKAAYTTADGYFDTLRRFGVVMPGADWGELVAKIGNQSYGYHVAGAQGAINYKATASQRLYLMMNDTSAGYGNNQGALDVSVMISIGDFDQASVTVGVPSTETWMRTGVFVGPGRPYGIVATGSWTDGGNGFVGPAGLVGRRIASTIVPSADASSLVGRVGTTTLAIGDGSYNPSYPVGGDLRLSMNDTLGLFHNNSGQVSVAITVGYFPIID